MANPVRIKRRAAGGAAGAPSSLLSAEPAFNEQDDILYYGKGDSAGNATSIVPIGGSGAFLTLNTTQTVTGDKTFSGNVALGSLATATTQTGTDNSTKVATTAFVKGQGYITSNQNITLSGDVSGTGTTSISVTIGANKVTNSMLAQMATMTIKGNNTGGAANAVDLTAAQAKALLAIVPGDVSGFDTQVRTSRLDQMAAPTASVSLNSQKITNLLTPTLDTDAATKAYVDSVATGLDWKASCRATTTANITLSGTQTIDGVAVVAGDRVLVKDQSTGSSNGIYVVSAGAWSRATDADSSTEVTSGMCTFVTEGTTNGDKAWVLTTNDPITLGSTTLTFTQMTGASTGETNTASNVGTSGTGVFDGKVGVDLQFRKINAASTKLTVTLNGQQIDIDLAQSNITGVGTIASGTWQGTAVALGYGGTGANLSGASDGTIFKKSGTALVAATAGTDYLNSSSTIDGGVF